MDLFKKVDFLKLDVDYSMNIKDNEYNIKGNFIDYILPIFKDEFKLIYQTQTNISIDSALYIKDAIVPCKIFIIPDGEGYEVISYKTSLGSDILGYFLFDTKTNYIITAQFSSRCQIINEGVDFFKYENEFDLSISKDHYNTYINFLRYIKEHDKSYIEINYKGKLKWCEIRCVYAKNGSYYIAFVDASETFSLNVSYLKKSFKDPLTGVYQRDSISEYIKDYLSLYSENQAMLAIIDLDYFKTINDTYGHSFGDLVISRTCETFKKVLSRYPDSEIGRIGGDEFLLFVPNVVSRDDIKDLASKIRIETMKISYKEIKSFSLSCTMGISKYPFDGESFEVLFKKADKALYRGKAKGRDCYIIYDEALHGSIDENRQTINLEEISLNAFIQNNKTKNMCKIVADLYQSSDKSEMIKKSIDDFARLNNIERIIIEYEKNDKVFKYAYVSDEFYRPSVEYYSISNIKQYLDYFNADFILHAANTNTLKFKNVELQQMYLRFKTSAFVTCAIMEDKAIEGFISYEMNTVKRVWQKEEITNFIVFKEFLIFIINKFCL